MVSLAVSPRRPVSASFPLYRDVRMPSPFPGMDPYLEGYLWPDVHHRLATQISDQLMPLLRPRYVARIEIQVVPDETPEADIGIMYPDVEIVRARQSDSALPSASAATGALTAASQPITPAALSVPLLDIEVRLATVEIRDTASNRLVTSIEILSPVNKREPGLSKYRDKRRQLHAADVHILEIDLLRRGQRPLAHPRIPPSAYRHYPHPRHCTLCRYLGSTPARCSPRCACAATPARWGYSPGPRHSVYDYLRSRRV